MVLVEKLDPPNPLALLDVPLDASLSTIVPMLESVDLACGGEPNPENAATLGNVTLDTSLSTVPKLRPVEVVFEGEPKPEKPVMLGAVPKFRPVVLVFETESLATVVLAPNRPPFGDAFEMPLLEDVAFEPTGLRDEDLGVSLLGDKPSEARNIPNVDGDFVVPKRLLLRGDGVDGLLMEVADFELGRLPPKDSVLF